MLGRTGSWQLAEAPGSAAFLRTGPKKAGMYERVRVSTDSTVYECSPPANATCWKEVAWWNLENESRAE